MDFIQLYNTNSVFHSLYGSTFDKKQIYIPVFVSTEGFLKEEIP